MGRQAAYNHLQCAPALLWLAEALGEDPAVLHRAIRDVQAAAPRGASQCAAVRRHIPWSRIEELTRTHTRTASPWRTRRHRAQLRR